MSEHARIAVSLLLMVIFIFGFVGGYSFSRDREELEEELELCEQDWDERVNETRIICDERIWPGAQCREIPGCHFPECAEDYTRSSFCTRCARWWAGEPGSSDSVEEP